MYHRVIEYITGLGRFRQYISLSKGRYAVKNLKKLVFIVVGGVIAILLPPGVRAQRRARAWKKSIADACRPAEEIAPLFIGSEAPPPIREGQLSL
jgi:hypothetical protein